jgi:hypothetical protein
VLKNSSQLYIARIPDASLNNSGDFYSWDLPVPFSGNRIIKDTDGFFSYTAIKVRIKKPPQASGGLYII